MYQINRKNLTILRDYVKNNVSDKQFNMKQFRIKQGSGATGFWDYSSNKEYFNTCGTIGCALGWLPHALEDANVEWNISEFYSLSYEYLNIDGRIWDYLFHYSWSQTEYSSREDFIERANIILGMTDAEIIKIKEEKLHPKHIAELEYFLFKRS